MTLPKRKTNLRKDNLLPVPPTQTPENEMLGCTGDFKIKISTYCEA